MLSKFILNKINYNIIGNYAKIINSFNNSTYNARNISILNYNNIKSYNHILNFSTRNFHTNLSLPTSIDQDTSELQDEIKELKSEIDIFKKEHKDTFWEKPLICILF